MPPSGPVPDLGPLLYAVLLPSLLWISVAALVVAVCAWVLDCRGSVVFARVRLRLLGSAEGQPEHRGRYFLRVSLGLLWILDGLLQAQPTMPAGFVRHLIGPGVAGSPAWLAAVVNPLADVWTRHPISADAATVWVQVGLGVLILVGGRGLLITVALWTSVAWSLAVWTVGEFLGGLLVPGASWLTGAPGAVLVYGLAALLLLAPEAWWSSGRSALLARRSVAAWMLLGAVLQALPWEGSWSASGLSEPFSRGLGNNQPVGIRQPISWVVTVALDRPLVLNATIIAVLLAVGTSLWVSGRRAVLVAGVLVCSATWWLAQDFGVLGGLGTDPNTALPLALLLVAASPRWASQPVAVGARPGHRLRTPLAAGLTAAGVGAALVAPLAVIATLASPAGAAAIAADTGGGVVRLPHRPVPPFVLTDQDHRTVSTASLAGKLTLLTFLDPVCSDDCPLIANQLAEADRELGPLAQRIQIVAIDSNPLFTHVSDTAAFTTSHDLTSLPNWHFLSGQSETVQSLLSWYGIGVAVPAVGMIQHGEGVYFLGPDGSQVAYVADGANASLTQGYAAVIGDEVRRLLA